MSISTFPEGITDDDDYDAIMKKVFMASKRALDDTLHIINSEEYKKVLLRKKDTLSIKLDQSNRAINLNKL